jgi:hypothetical protein
VAELQSEVREQLERLAAVLERVADPGNLEDLDLEEQVRHLAADAISTARRAAYQAHSETRRSTAPVPYATVVAQNVRRFRGGLALTQADLARMMSRLGFDWKRITVAEVERTQSPRRLSFDELAGLAFLLEQPIASLLLSHDRQQVQLEPGWVLTADQLKRLLVGGGYGAVDEWLGDEELPAVFGLAPETWPEDQDPEPAARELGTRRRDR